MSTSKLFINISLLTIVLTCCGHQKPKNFDYGSVTDNTYQNRFFDFSMQLPEDWTVLSEEQTNQLVDKGLENNPIKKDYLAAEDRTAILLNVSQQKTDGFNPSIVLVSEDVRMAPIKSGRDYLQHTKLLLLQTQYDHDYISDSFESEIISGAVFFKMETHLSVAFLEEEPHLDIVKVVIKQSYYSTIIKGFCLSAIISYDTPEQKDILLKSIQSIKFGL